MKTVSVVCVLLSLWSSTNGSLFKQRLLNLFGPIHNLHGEKTECENIITCTQLVLSSTYRTTDGSCNNINHPEWGMAGIPFRRLLNPAYADGESSPRTSLGSPPLPSAREISREFHMADDGDAPVDAVDITHMLMQWGQFLDHDITITPMLKAEVGDDLVPFACCEDDVTPISPNDEALTHDQDICLPIPISGDDQTFSGRNCINFVRSERGHNEFCYQYPEEQKNANTAFIDASNVYGSSDAEMNQLRVHTDGLMAVSSGQLLPPNDDDRACAEEVQSPFCFKAGDERANEQMGLTSMHTVWIREHNRIATSLKSYNPHWNDETLFQEARKIVGAMMQKITYDEFLPLILGSKADDLKPLPPGPNFRDVYDPEVDPSMINSFSTAAFRFGHSLIRGQFSRRAPDFTPTHANSLQDLFGTTSFLHSDASAVGAFLRGIASENARQVDRVLNPVITNHLFEIPGQPMSGLDLAALNIQRGRDHGIPGYILWRSFCAIHEGDYSRLRTDTSDIPQRLLDAYNGNLHQIDLFAGGLSESPEAGQGLVGPTFACLLAIQFGRLQAGDRFWFENNGPHGFTIDKLNELRKVSLSRVLCDNTDTTDIQPNAFRLPNAYTNPVTSCSQLNSIDLSKWSEVPQN